MSVGRKRSQWCYFRQFVRGNLLMGDLHERTILCISIQSLYFPTHTSNNTQQWNPFRNWSQVRSCKSYQKMSHWTWKVLCQTMNSGKYRSSHQRHQNQWDWWTWTWSTVSSCLTLLIINWLGFRKSCKRTFCSAMKVGLGLSLSCRSLSMWSSMRSSTQGRDF